MVCIIEVGVYGGLVQWVRGVPRNIEVRVYDYDNDGVDESLLDLDADGNRCIVSAYDHEVPL